MNNREEIINELNSLKEELELNRFIYDEKKLIELYEQILNKYDQIFEHDQNYLLEKKQIYLRSIIKQAVLFLSIKEFSQCRNKINDLINEKERLDINFNKDAKRELHNLINLLKNVDVSNEIPEKDTQILRLETFLVE